VRLTEQQYADLQRRQTVATAVKAAKKSKYKNVRCQSADGKKFDSKLERNYYEQLLLRWKAGDVRWFIRQVNFELSGGVDYRADFLVVGRFGDVEVIDTTGALTQTKANKLKQLKARYGIEVHLVRSV
jgi:hypothetical protein